MSDEPEPGASWNDSIPVEIEKVQASDPPPEVIPVKPSARLSAPLNQLDEPILSSMPHNLEAEQQVICYLVMDGEQAFLHCDAARITPESFFDFRHTVMFRRLAQMRRESKPIAADTFAAELQAVHELEMAGGMAYVIELTGRAPTTLGGTYFIEKLRESAIIRQLMRSAGQTISACKNFNGGTGSIDDFLTENRIAFEAIANQTSTEAAKDEKIRARIESRKFNFATPPKEPVPRFLINDKPICTPGNLTSITAQSKTGKSSFLEAMMSAACVAFAKTTNRDTLGVTASAPNGLHLVHFDTEQSIYDHDQLIRRALRRADIPEIPKWLHSFCLTGFSAADIRRLIRLKLEDAKILGGVFALLIDGIADCVVNVNDPDECNPFVGEIHDYAIEFDCPIVCNLHENPGQDFGKGRGHLGSQLERKAESNLRLRKVEEVITVFSEKMRKGAILEKDGPRFSWSNQDGMHMSCESLGESKDDAKRESLKTHAEAIFTAANKESLAWGEIIDAISSTTGIAKSSATKRFDTMKSLGVVKKDLIGRWRLA